MAHYNRVLLIGEMTASIAHELNQPLTAINNNAGAASRFIEQGKIGPVLIEVLSDIVADTRRARDVIQNVRSLGAQGRTYSHAPESKLCRHR
jgi:C4-dicarboxylate-specific signal transduction histidine kinase